MKTFLFATCYIGKPEYLERYRNYLKYYIPRLDKLGASTILLIDDGSPLEILSKLNIPIIELEKVNNNQYPALTEPAYIFRFPDRLGRPTRTIFAGWWRSFSFMSILAYVYRALKLIHIESDTYVLTDKMFDWLKNTNSVWAAPYSRQDRYPESCIQVIPEISKINWWHPTKPKNNFKILFDFFRRGNEFFFKNNLADFQYIPELSLQFDEIVHDFKGDRYGEDWCRKIPENIDYIANTNDTSLSNLQHKNLYSKQDIIDKLLNIPKPEGDNLTGFHSGDMGDIIYAIPTMKALGIKKLYLNPLNWYGTKMNYTIIKFLKPLLTANGFVVEVPSDLTKIHIDYNLDKFRVGQDLVWTHLGLSQAMAQKIEIDLSQPWLKNPKSNQTAEVVINRSARYHGVFFDWRKIIEVLKEENASTIFVGLFEEFEQFLSDFSAANGFITYHPVRDALDLANVIGSAKLFIGNQSTPFAIAEGLKVNRLQETCEWDPNCLPGNYNGVAVLNEDDMVRGLEFVTECMGENMVNNQTLSLLTTEKYDILKSYIDKAPNGNFAELGVYKGGVAYLMAQKCKEKVYLFDTFTGIPNANEDNDWHQNGDFNDTSIEEVKELLKEFNNIEYCVGVFPETALNIKPEIKFSCIHLDGDTYSTTIDGLNFFYERLVSGGYIILDDYNWSNCPGVNKAIEEFIKSTNRSGYWTQEYENQFVIGKL